MLEDDAAIDQEARSQAIVRELKNRKAASNRRIKRMLRESGYNPTKDKSPYTYTERVILFVGYLGMLYIGLRIVGYFLEGVLK